MNIGIIVATEVEKRPFLDVFGKPADHYPNDRHPGDRFRGYEVEKWIVDRKTEIYLIQSGFGEIAATSSTQYLIDNYLVDIVINYGAVGGLDEANSVGKIGYVNKVVHYDFDISTTGNYSVGEYPGKGVYLRPIEDAIPQAIMKRYGLSELTCASADKFVRAGKSKKRLHRDFGADICEMEAAGIVITCNRSGVPVTLIKAVSDGVDEDSEAFDKNVYYASLRCVRFLHEIIVGR